MSKRKTEEILLDLKELQKKMSKVKEEFASLQKTEAALTKELDEAITKFELSKKVKEFNEIVK